MVSGFFLSDYRSANRQPLHAVQSVFAHVAEFAVLAASYLVSIKMISRPFILAHASHVVESALKNTGGNSMSLSGIFRTSEARSTISPTELAAIFNDENAVASWRT